MHFRNEFNICLLCKNSENCHIYIFSKLQSHQELVQGTAMLLVPRTVHMGV
jgi:hypothetical protein